MIRNTSIKTYLNEIAPTLGARQIKVLEIFENSTDEDMTNNEIKSRIGWEINQVTPRVKELRDLGILEESCIRPCRTDRRMVHAWRLKKRSTEAPAAGSPLRTIRPISTFFQLPSRSNPSKTHVLKSNGYKIACNCKGYHFRGDCSHVKKLERRAPDPADEMKKLF